MFDLFTPLSFNFQEENERRFLLYSLADADPGFQEILRLRWKEDPIAFISDCLCTYDPRDNKDWQYRPFVPWGKQGNLINLLTGRAPNSVDYDKKVRPTIVRKSRDEGGSIIIAAIVLWDWLFNAGDHGLMCRAGYQLHGGAFNSLFGKLEFTLNNLPLWLVPWRAKNDHIRKQPPQILHPENGAVILGSTTVDGGWRGARMKYIWVDEAAWIPNMHSILTSIFAACDTPVLVSSVAGKGNTFYQVDVGEGYTTTDAGEGSAGWMRTELHYRDNPSKSKQWIENKRISMTPNQWAQEYECDYAASAPGRIWPEYDARHHVLTKSQWEVAFATIVNKNLPILEGWDFGITALTAVVWAAYDADTDILYILDSYSWTGEIISKICADVGTKGWYCKSNPQGVLPTKRIGDPAGKIRDSMHGSPFVNLVIEGNIKVTEMRLKSIPAIHALIRQKISRNKILLAPRCAIRPPTNLKLPTISECIEQYRCEGEGIGLKAKKDIYSHAADALQYICAAIWQHSGGTGMVETY